jgi:Holliday junction resolvase RusA-like endonuclease
VKRGDPLFKSTKPDRDNLLKLLNDALEGIIFINDSQVCGGAVSKVYDENPMTVIEIQEFYNLEV